MIPARGASMAMVFLALAGPSRGESLPVPGSADPRIRIVAYEADQVYRLRGYVGYQIDLQFEAGESFVGLGAGDIDGLAFVGKENHLFLKPRALKIATNITVLTSRREYQFDYSAAAHLPSEPSEVLYALRFTYAPSKAERAEAEGAQKLEQQLKEAASTRPRNADYWFCGDISLRPTAASDDGVHTRLTFAADAELPAIFVRSDDGTESLLNFSMDEGDVVIHRVAHRLVLRRGRLEGCVVNQGYSGTSRRLSSGTVAPNVERRVREVKP